MREPLIGQCPYCEGNLTNGHKCRQMLETIAIERGEPQPTASGMNSIDCGQPVSGPSPATASSAPIEPPMSERERKFADAIIAMVEAGWLLHNEKGMTNAQKKCLEAYILAKKERENDL